MAFKSHFGWAYITCYCTRERHDTLQTSLMGSHGHQVTLACRDVPGLSWDVPHGILQTPSDTCIQGCCTTVLGRSSWDPLDTKLIGISQKCPSTGSSPLFRTVPDISLCLDSPGMCPTLVDNTGHSSIVA